VVDGKVMIHDATPAQLTEASPPGPAARLATPAPARPPVWHGAPPPC
jgi:hypothetical protein